jgi:hypothetical protein
MPHRNDATRLKVYAEQHSLSYKEAAEQAFDHYCFVVRDPFQEVRRDAKDLIKRLPEAVSIAQKQGLMVELGSTEYYHSPLDKGKIAWGASHLPACRVTKDGQVRYYFPDGFVKFALDGCIGSENEREGKYPYNPQGQAQLEKLFVEGKPKDKADELCEETL